MSVTSYQCLLFILPKKIIKQVDDICRQYLWFGKHDSGPGNVNWKQVYRPMMEGGLGVRCLESWNVAAVEKIAWKINMHGESLWVKWVHEIYMKGGTWMRFNPPTIGSWVLKKLCTVKETLRVWMIKNTYSIKNVYEELLGQNPRVPWAITIWNRASLPKARFIW